MRKPRRVIGWLVSVVAALALAAPASAAYWQHGPGWLGNGYNDSDCIWYYGQASCSGWSYWYRLQYQDVTSVCCFTYLLGFENNARIRGLWVYDYVEYVDMSPNTVDMSGNLKAHMTWWSGNGVSVLAWANS